MMDLNTERFPLVLIETLLKHHNHNTIPALTISLTLTMTLILNLTRIIKFKIGGYWADILPLTRFNLQLYGIRQLIWI